VSTNQSSPRKLIVFAIGMTALAVVLLWAAYLVRDVILVLYISALLAIGFSPIVRLIERQRLLPVGTRRFPRWLAILVLYVFIIGLLIGIGVLVFPPLADQAQEFWAQKNQLFERVQKVLVDRGFIREPVTLREAVEHSPVATGDAVGTVFGAVRGVIGGVFGFVTILILTFYFLVGAGNLRTSFLRFFAPEQRPRVDAVTRAITVKVSAWLGGQLLLGGVIGVTSAIGLWLLGVPFFYVLAVISGIGELIPIVGPILSAIPAVLVGLTVSYKTALFVLIFFIAQQQFENHVLVPKVMERQVGVSAPFVITSLLIGGKLLGILGALLAVPTAAILQVLVSELMEEREKGFEAKGRR
jgi:predicted PurR-regulated permease PerM